LPAEAFIENNKGKIIITEATQEEFERGASIEEKDWLSDKINEKQIKVIPNNVVNIFRRMPAFQNVYSKVIGLRPLPGNTEVRSIPSDTDATVVALAKVRNYVYVGEGGIHKALIGSLKSLRVKSIYIPEPPATNRSGSNLTQQE
jgi:hypothetical protein